MNRYVVITEWGVLEVALHDPTGTLLAPPTHVVVTKHRADDPPRIADQGRVVAALERDAERYRSHYGWHYAVVLPVQTVPQEPASMPASTRTARRIDAWHTLRDHYRPIDRLDGNGYRGNDRWLVVQRDNTERHHAFLLGTSPRRLLRDAAGEALGGWTPLVLVDLDTGAQQDLVVSPPEIRTTRGTSHPNPLTAR